MAGIKIKGNNNNVNGKICTGEFVFEPEIKLNDEQQAILDNYLRVTAEAKAKAENKK
ncbi:MAG: hypothetical protein ACRC6E_10320 [Fusobacteriaceae bacterium]